VALDGFLDKAAEIPLIGGMFKSLMSGPVNKMKQGITNAGKSFVTDFRDKLDSGVPMMNALKSAGGGAMKLLRAAINPVVLGILAIGAGIAMAIGRFNAIQDAAKKFREETGLLNSQTQGLVSNIQTVSRDMAGIGASAEDVASAASAFTKEFDNLQQPSKGVLTSMVGMEKSFGVSAANQAKVNEQFQRMAGVSAETAQSMIQTTVQAAKLAGVAPAQVMADIADNSEAAYKYFNGSPKALAKAAVEAAKLGTSIGQASDLSSKLLDFESSISSELNASAMLGTNINFNEARRLAASKDIIGAQQAVVKEVSKLGDLTKLSVFEQEALAEAAGMPIGDLIKQQQIRERLGDATEDQLAAANKLLDSGMEMKDITDEQLAQEAQRIAQQNEMQSQNDRLKNSLSALGAGFADVFMPVINFVMPLINDLIDMVNTALMPAFKILSSVFKITFGVLSAVIQPVFAVLKALVSAAMKPFEAIGNAVEPLADKFAGLKDGVMTFAQPLIGVFKSIGNIIGNVVGGAVGVLVDIISFLFDVSMKIFSSIGRLINTYLIKPFGAVIDFVGNVFSSIGGVIDTYLIKPFGKVVDFVGNVFSKIGESTTSFGDIFKSVFLALTTPIRTIISFIKNVFSNVFDSVKTYFGGIIDIFKGIFSLDISMIGEGVKKVFSGIFKMITAAPKALLDTIFTMFPAVGDFFKNLFANAFDGIKTTFGGIIDIFKGLFTLDFSMVGDGIKQVFSGIFKMITTIPKTLISTIFGLFPAVGEFFTSIAGKIKNFFMGILPEWAQKLLGGGSSGEVSNNSQIQEDGVATVSGLEVSPINDTNMSSPGELSNVVQTTNNLTAASETGKPGWVDDMITAVSANKDVYMDGKKVTSGVNRVVDSVGTNSYSLG
jgi:phage-related protein